MFVATKTYFYFVPCAALQGGRLPRPAININRIPVTAIKIEQIPLPHGIGFTGITVICTTSEFMPVVVESYLTP